MSSLSAVLYPEYKNKQDIRKDVLIAPESLDLDTHYLGDNTYTLECCL